MRNRDEPRTGWDGAPGAGGQGDDTRAWDRLAAVLREDPPGPAPEWLEARVMDEVRTGPSPAGGVVDWLLRPREIRASPLTAGLAAAAVVVLAVLPWLRGGEAGPPVPGPEPEAVVWVQFVVEAPEARSVAVAGDFTRWSPDGTLEDPDGDGVWTGRLPLRPGVHEYMFVVDGERWITDPRADRWVDDGFGNRNAVIAVAHPGRS
jgi:hypothetical protein